ncbi:MAG: hypothetical protein HFH35_11110 [Eubacterium sp.]|nr:hypothetical protein [Eubacterium sp.]
MRKRIEELAEGVIPYEHPQVVFSKEKLELEAVEGQGVTDSFQITSKNAMVMRGIVYSSSVRMECLTPQFEGKETEIKIRYHADGMREGDIATGDLYVVCNGGEYRLSYAVTVTRVYAETDAGRIKNLSDYTKLARHEWLEAYQLFRSPAFQNILAKKDYKASLLYGGFTNSSVTERTMEEFLIGIGKKERVRFTLEKRSAEFFSARSPFEEKVHVQKEGWGFLEVRIYSSDDFLVPLKTYLTDRDFAGSSYPLHFYIDTSKMHAGNNFASIYLENDTQKEEFQVWVSADSLENGKDRTYRKAQRIQFLLTKCYVDYRLGKLVTGEWTKQTLDLIRQLEKLRMDDDWHMLFKAYALQRNKQRQDAEWLLRDFRQKFKDKKKPLWAFYSYLRLQNEKEPVVVDQLLTEIEAIAKRYAAHPMMFFLTLRLNGVLRSQLSVRLRVIEERVMRGQFTPLWYVEALQVYLEQPYLLTKLDKYEILLLNWASRQAVLTRDLADQVMHLANNMRYFHPVICRILFRCYEQYPDEDMLAGVCAYLIKGQRYQPKHHCWYAKGIAENLKITGLYEAFLLTMDLYGQKPLPKVIQMYFQYNNQLAYKYKAALYVNIILHKEQEPAIYAKYTETMKQFAIDEILKGHMDDNLAVIYEEVLDKGILTQELAGPLADILYTHKFYCENPSAAYVIIIQKHIREEQRVPLIGGSAYFQLFSNDYAVILENNRGQRFVDPESCQLQKLMKPSHYIRRCLKFAPDKLQFLIHHLDGKTGLDMPQPSDVEYLQALMDAPLISRKFKSQIGPGLIRYCLSNHIEEYLEDYFALVDFAGMEREKRNVLIELMIENGWNEKAYALVGSYGYEGVDPQRLAQMLGYLLRATEAEEDAFLLELCITVLLAGARGPAMTAYLAKYYEGPSKRMMAVYKAARQAGMVDVHKLEERLLVQVLYSTEYVDGIQEVYQDYRMHNGLALILQAYRSYCMHEYVVSDTVLPQSLFLEAEKLHAEGKLRGTACRLGLLKYFSQCPSLDAAQLRGAEILLEEFIGKNMKFAFFKRLPVELCGRYQLHNRILVEYHARPDSRMRIHYRMPQVHEEFLTRNMPDRYDGIFTWEFLLFLGDELEYYITEETENGEYRLCESRRVPGNAYSDIKNGGRYAYINQMLILRGQGKDRELLYRMQEYGKLEIMTDKLFKVIS